MNNPLTGKVLPERHAEHVEKLRMIRRNARKASRSGNPAKRIPAIRATALAAAEIRRVYLADATRKAGTRRIVLDGTYVNPDKDRSRPGKKARRRARKAARGLARRAFFKGHGVASENAYNLRYECDCGFGIVASLDDAEFMTDVMDHEAEHAEAAS